ncbi:hypothetical protein ADE_45330 [Achromobacter denitrificans]|nr:hypothetical protein ADE_45330 [Achromobacter denitrificans]
METTEPWPEAGAGGAAVWASAGMQYGNAATMQARVLIFMSGCPPARMKVGELRNPDGAGALLDAAGPEGMRLAPGAMGASTHAVDDTKKQNHSHYLSYMLNM